MSQLPCVKVVSSTRGVRRQQHRAHSLKAHGGTAYRRSTEENPWKITNSTTFSGVAYV